MSSKYFMMCGRCLQICAVSTKSIWAFYTNTQWNAVTHITAYVHTHTHTHTHSIHTLASMKKCICTPTHTVFIIHSMYIVLLVDWGRTPCFNVITFTFTYPIVWLAALLLAVLSFPHYDVPFKANPLSDVVFPSFSLSASSPSLHCSLQVSLSQSR